MHLIHTLTLLALTATVTPTITPIVNNNYTTIDNVKNLDINDSSVSVFVDYTQPLLAQLHLTSVHSLNCLYEDSYYNPAIKDIPIDIADYIASDGFGLVFTGMYDTEVQKAKEALRANEEYFDNLFVNKSDDYKRAINILGRDILLDSEWINTKKIYKYQRSEEERLPLNTLIQDTYKALGLYEYTYEKYYSAVDSFDIGQIAIQEQLGIQLYEDDPFDLSRGRCDLFVSRTNLNNYWKKALVDDVLYSYENETTVVTLARYCSILQQLLYIHGESVMTEQEQYYLLQLYGKDIPYYLDNADELEAVKYLFAKGILSPDDVTNYTAPVDLELLLTILSRVADVNSRLTFKDVQLTLDVNLLSKGYYETELTTSPIQVSTVSVEATKSNNYDIMIPVDTDILLKHADGTPISFKKYGLCSVYYDTDDKAKGMNPDTTIITYHGQVLHDNKLYAHFSINRNLISTQVIPDGNNYPYTVFNEKYVIRSTRYKANSYRYIMLGAQTTDGLKVLKIKVGNLANAAVNYSSVFAEVTEEHGRLQVGGWYYIKDDGKTLQVNNSCKFKDATYSDSHNMFAIKQLETSEYRLQIPTAIYDKELFGDPSTLYMSYKGYAASYKKDNLQTSGISYLGEEVIDNKSYHVYTVTQEAIDAYTYTIDAQHVYITLCSPLSYATYVTTGFATLNIADAIDYVLTPKTFAPVTFDISGVSRTYLDSDYESSIGLVLRSTDKNVGLVSVLKSVTFAEKTLYDITNYAKGEHSGTIVVNGKTLTISLATVSNDITTSTTVKVTISGAITKEVFRENFKVSTDIGYTAYTAYAKNGSRVLANLDWLIDLGYVEYVKELDTSTLGVFTKNNAIYLRKTSSANILVVGTVIYEVPSDIILWEYINNSIYIDYAATLGWLGTYVTYTNEAGAIVPSFSSELLATSIITKSCVSMADSSISSDVQIMSYTDKSIVLSSAYQFANYFIYCADTSGKASLDVDMLFVFKPVCSGNYSYDDSTALHMLAQLLGGSVPIDDEGDPYWKVYAYQLSKDNEANVNPPNISYNDKYGYIYTPPVVDVGATANNTHIDTIDELNSTDLDAKCRALASRYIKSAEAKYPLVLPFVYVPSSVRQLNGQISNGALNVKCVSFKPDVIYDLNTNTYKTGNSTYLPYLYEPLCYTNHYNDLYVTTCSKSGTQLITGLSTKATVDGAVQHVANLYVSRMVLSSKNLITTTAELSNVVKTKNSYYFTLSGTRFCHTNKDLTKATEIAAPVGVVAQITGVGNFSWDVVANTYVQVYYGTRLLDRTIKDGKVVLSYNRSPVCSEETDSDMTFSLLLRSGTVVAYVVNSVGLESTFEYLQREDEMFDEVNNDTYNTGSTSKNMVDWNKFKYKQLIDNYDTLISLLLIVALTIIPRIASFGFMTTLALTFIADSKLWQRICDRFIDPYKVLTLGRQNVHTMRKGASLYYMILGEAFIALFTDGNIILFFTWLAQAFAQLTSY